MPRPKWTFSVDIDGVLCESGPPDKYAQAKPIKDNIKMVNALYDKGFNVILYTGRGWHMYDMTKEWLTKNSVKHTELVMGKVVAHYYIDDRNATLDEVYGQFFGTAEPDNGQVRAL